MVRNTRTLMMYGLLAAATAAVLGSRVVPAPRTDQSALLALVPGLVGLGALESQVWKQATPATAAPPVIADQPLEGNRQPRGPRQSRDTLDRPTR